MIDNFRKARCICVYADWFWKVSLFSITSNNERTKSYNCLLTTLSFDEGIYFLNFIYMIFFYMKESKRRDLV